jgi:hypothetical protein
MSTLVAHATYLQVDSLRYESKMQTWRMSQMGCLWRKLATTEGEFQSERRSADASRCLLVIARRCVHSSICAVSEGSGG